MKPFLYVAAGGLLLALAAAAQAQLQGIDPGTGDTVEAATAPVEVTILSVLEDTGSELTDIERRMKANYDSAVMDVIIADPWFTHTPAMREELSKGLKERGIERGRIGIEELGTTITEYGRLKKALPGAELELADDAFAYARQVKTPDEIELFEEIGKQATDVGNTEVAADAYEQAMYIAYEQGDKPKARELYLKSLSQEERDKFREIAKGAWKDFAAQSDLATEAYDTHIKFMRSYGLLK